jgi:hypothetical protein
MYIDKSEYRQENNYGFEEITPQVQLTSDSNLKIVFWTNSFSAWMDLKSFCSYSRWGFYTAVKGTRGSLLWPRRTFPTTRKNPPTKELRDIVDYCSSRRKQLIIGCDANAHHILCGGKFSGIFAEF